MWWSFWAPFPCWGRRSSYCRGCAASRSAPRPRSSFFASLSVISCVRRLDRLSCAGCGCGCAAVVVGCCCACGCAAVWLWLYGCGYVAMGLWLAYHSLLTRCLVHCTSDVGKFLATAALNLADDPAASTTGTTLCTVSGLIGQFFGEAAATWNAMLGTGTALACIDDR